MRAFAFACSLSQLEESDRLTIFKRCGRVIQDGGGAEPEFAAADSEDRHMLKRLRKRVKALLRGFLEG